MLKFCANLSMLFTELPFAERFQAAKQAGFDAVEIQFPYQLPAAQIAEILAQQLLKLVLFNVDADDLLQGGEGLACVPAKKQRFKQALEQTVEYAQILKPEAINVLPGRCFDNNQTVRYLETFKENLQLALTAFRGLGIKTVFEAINTVDMPNFLISSGAQMLEILTDINQPDLFMQYDVYHADKMGENWAEFIGTHSDKIGHLQFADNPGRGQPGTGKIDFKRLLSVVENSAYQGWLGAEYKPTKTTLNSLNWYPYRFKVTT